jgi:hypothetical protein
MPIVIMNGTFYYLSRGSLDQTSYPWFDRYLMMMPKFKTVYLSSNVLLWFFIECLFTTIGTKVVSLPLVFGFTSGRLGINFHTTYKVFYHKNHLLSYRSKNFIQLILSGACSDFESLRDRKTCRTWVFISKDAY